MCNKKQEWQQQSILPKNRETASFSTCSCQACPTAKFLEYWTRVRQEAGSFPSALLSLWVASPFKVAQSSLQIVLPHTTICKNRMDEWSEFPHACRSLVLIGRKSVLWSFPCPQKRLLFHTLLTQNWSQAHAHNAEDGKASIWHFQHLKRELALPERRWAVE